MKQKWHRSSGKNTKNFKFTWPQFCWYESDEHVQTETEASKSRNP